MRAKCLLIHIYRRNFKFQALIAANSVWHIIRTEALEKEDFRSSHRISGVREQFVAALHRTQRLQFQFEWSTLSGMPSNAVEAEYQSRILDPSFWQHVEWATCRALRISTFNRYRGNRCHRLLKVLGVEPSVKMAFEPGEIVNVVDTSGMETTASCPRLHRYKVPINAWTSMAEFGSSNVPSSAICQSWAREDAHVPSRGGKHGKEILDNTMESKSPMAK